MTSRSLASAGGFTCGSTKQLDQSKPRCVASPIAARQSRKGISTEHLIANCANTYNAPMLTRAEVDVEMSDEVSRISRGATSSPQQSPAMAWPRSSRK
jgi:hypothetical protein